MYYYSDYVVNDPQNQYYANYEPQGQQYTNYQAQFYVPNVMMQQGYSQMPDNYSRGRGYHNNRGNIRGRGFRGHSYSQNRGERPQRTRQTNTAENTMNGAETELQNKMEAYLKDNSNATNFNSKSNTEKMGDSSNTNSDTANQSKGYHSNQSRNNSANQKLQESKSSVKSPAHSVMSNEEGFSNENERTEIDRYSRDRGPEFDKYSGVRGARGYSNDQGYKRNYRRDYNNFGEQYSRGAGYSGRKDYRRDEIFDTKGKQNFSKSNRYDSVPTTSNFKVKKDYDQMTSDLTMETSGKDQRQKSSKGATASGGNEQENNDPEYFNSNREHYENRKQFYSRKTEVADGGGGSKYRKQYNNSGYSRKENQRRELNNDVRGEKQDDLSSSACASSEWNKKSNLVSLKRNANERPEILKEQNIPSDNNIKPAKGHRRPQVMRTLSGKVDESQRGLLIEQLTLGTYECMVCCETIRGQNAVWNCINCYHVFHLRCVKQWARLPLAHADGADRGWRCPGCQNICHRFPNQYRCFCGKVRDPEWNRMETPHSCGEVCKKSRGDNCPHPCILLCHPGPCPPCNASVKRTCNCGKTSQTLKCSSTDVLRCESVCGKQLNCGRHNCKQVCHSGSCSPCEETITQECYGEHESREVLCGSKESFTECFCCNKPCNKILSCGNHRCESICHRGDCEECERLPSRVTKCPCGATDLSEISDEPRKSCLDAIPHCDQVCGKQLTCGNPENPHTCKQRCHEGACGPCEGLTLLRCRCGTIEKEFPCKEIAQFEENEFTCDRRCNKKRSCGRHKCGQLCCVREEHNCELICGKKLSCGLHRCEEPCHRGNCPPCLMASFDELTCHCSAEVLYPPIPCGTRPPECKQICTREHSCNHTVLHKCHSEDNCPPCTALTEKWCMGQHELRKNIPCHLPSISCGLPCNRELPCKQHKCIRKCHSGDCQEEGGQCKQPCLYKRPDCEHACGQPCHSGQPCPSVPCKSEITIKCPCGHKTAKVPCNQGGPGDTSYQWRNMASSLQMGQSVDITQLTSSKKTGKRQLECDAECATVERNRRVALALEIKNPDLQGKLGNPNYTDFLREFAKNNIHIVASVEKSLSDLVQNAKKAKQTHRSHAFPSMNRDQRRFIHELAECYGCETQSYDYEPKKNVVATAYKEKCWLPTVTLTIYVQRELHPKAPQPIPHHSKESSIRQLAQASKQSFEVLSDKPIKPLPRKTTKSETAQTTKKSEPVIDYFDFSTT